MPVEPISFFHTPTQYIIANTLQLHLSFIQCTNNYTSGAWHLESLARLYSSGWTPPFRHFFLRGTTVPSPGTARWCTPTMTDPTPQTQAIATCFSSWTQKSIQEKHFSDWWLPEIKYSNCNVLGCYTIWATLQKKRARKQDLWSVEILLVCSHLVFLLRTF